MSNILIDLYKWNSWANEKYRKVLSTIEFNSLNIETSYGNLLDRIVHIFGSYKMWRERLDGKSPSKVIKASEFKNWEDLSETWREYENIMLEYVENLDESSLDDEIEYVSLDGKVYHRKKRQVLLHLTAHPNYHRGQLSAIFKERNLSNFPSTDMVLYYLENPS